MQIIIRNPYRILGLLASSTKRQQEKQTRRIRQYAEVGKNSLMNYSFPALGPLFQTPEEIDKASSKLTLDEDKIIAALFWFYEGNEITDEPAFDCLKANDIAGANDIWLKMIESGYCSNKNYSAFQNLSTLTLYKAFNTSAEIRSTDRIKNLELGIRLKLKLIESDYIKDFKELITDKTFQITKKKNFKHFFEKNTIRTRKK